MQVRIRYDYEVESALLCEAPLDRLDDVLPTVKRWGINGDNLSLCGQIAYDDTRREAYFEVIICTEGT